MNKEVLDPDRVLIIHDFLSREECTALIRRSENLRYEPGTVADVVIEEVRNNERVLVDDVSLAAEFFHRSEPWLPAVTMASSASTSVGAFTGMARVRPLSHIAMALTCA